MLPKISVVLTTHNRKPLLSRAIESVIAQEEPDFELVVVDDCSTDDTRQYLSSLTDTRLRVVRPPCNSGPSAARNLGISEAAADIVALMDDDDVYLPGRLSVPLAIFSREPDVVGILSSAHRIIPRASQVLRVPDAKLSPAAFEWAVTCNLVAPEGTGITFRRKAALEIGGFRTGFLWYECQDFLLRLARRGAGYLVDQALWRKYWSADAITSTWKVAGPNLLQLLQGTSPTADVLPKAR
jgi:glycosyltransferase involved in cell wall biosynthesis